MNISEAVQESLVENLFILTCGPIPPNPAKLLGSESMRQFIEQVKGDFDQILFDTPPILAVTDAQLMANQCDGTILILSSGNTDIDAAKRAKELLIAAKGKLLGAVLNKKKSKDSHYYYYYGHSN
ncbi:CpsD/CapB family tyrosine-protein kinase [Chungangia koreensis]|uniref:CpsD/CapB family tyrosine-protein kinase n=1 Tax=Chungangia koreensis TaxID=752657 RepID=A0ABV8X245_9LACT